MADVTVNINGDASRLRSELSNVGNEVDRVNQRGDRSRIDHRDDDRLDERADSRSAQHGSTLPPPQVPLPPAPDVRQYNDSSRSNFPTNDRMIDEIRREAQQRGTVLIPGSSTISQIVNQYTQGKKGEVDAQITDKYQGRLSDLANRRDKAYGEIDEYIEKTRRSSLATMGAQANDPLARQALENQLQQEQERRYRLVGSQFDQEEKDLADSENAERTAAENELTEAIRELTNYFNRQSSAGEDPNSYLGKLRAERKSIIAEREGATSEEGVLDASRRLGEVDARLAEALRGGQAQQGIPVDSALRGGQGLANMIGSASGGNLGGTIMGAGSTYAGLTGMGLKQALKFLGWVGVAATVADLAKDAATGAMSGSESFGQLANLRGATGGYGGKQGREILGWQIHRPGYEGLSLGALDINDEEFAQEAYSRTKKRGASANWFDETYKGLALEKTFSLDSGTLRDGAKYDRYGQNVTDALSRLVSMLSEIKDSGVSQGDFTRVQEKFDIQQQLMDSYMYRTDRPDYDIANKTLSAFSSVKGITQDQRVGGDIAAFQDAIQNPMNERMQALIYSTVSDLFPETRGKMDLIDRKINDPESEGKIMQAVFQRVQQMYGGTDTTMGYFAAKNLLGSIAPDRRDAYLNSMRDGTFTSNMLTKGKGETEAQKAKYDEDMKTYAKQSAESLVKMSKWWNDFVNAKDRSFLDIFQLRTPMPNKTYDGKE